MDGVRHSLGHQFDKLVVLETITFNLRISFDFGPFDQLFRVSQSETLTVRALSGDFCLEESLPAKVVIIV